MLETIVSSGWERVLSIYILVNFDQIENVAAVS